MRRLLRLLLLVGVGWTGVELYKRSRPSPATAGAGVVHTSAMARNVALARTSAKVGASYASHQARRATASPEKQAELDAAFEMKTAEEVANVLGNMKGALMKIGQMASFLDDGLPEAMRDALATLQADAPPMSADLAAQVIERELGAAPDAVFAEWDPQPISAASIGQVHRAVTKDGEAVAVKVQYPGVAEAITADLDNSQMLFSMLKMLFPHLDPKPLVDELRERLGEETDYRIEAKNQTDFARWYTEHPFIHVPRVFNELSTERVLTTELVDGARFDEVAQQWPDDEKQLAAEAIYRFVFRSLWAFHAFNGDPHPGNYLFHPGGRVTFLDFGLVKRFTQRDMDGAAAMIETLVLNDDIAAYRRTVEDIGFLHRDAPLTDEEVEQYFGYFYELIRHGGGHRLVTHEYAAAMVGKFFDPNGSKVQKYANMLPQYAILQRINLGLYAILARLEAKADWLKITEEIWPFAGGAPSTELGRAEAAWVARLRG
ncbi:MAG TPA: AarF/ABC1/UbiB kinase family protein [Acidimicrobiales bacterium]|nr:AarF/ABC1/UbiB kinase family protein [Acidimicrobiales bacterium]